MSLFVSYEIFKHTLLECINQGKLKHILEGWALDKLANFYANIKVPKSSVYTLPAEIYSFGRLKYLFSSKTLLSKIYFSSSAVFIFSIKSLSDVVLKCVFLFL